MRERCSRRIVRDTVVTLLRTHVSILLIVDGVCHTKQGCPGVLPRRVELILLIHSRAVLSMQCPHQAYRHKFVRIPPTRRPYAELYDYKQVDANVR